MDDESREWDEQEDPVETDCDLYGHEPVTKTNPITGDEEDVCARCGDICV